MYTKYYKTYLDYLLAFLLLIITSPIMLLISFILYFDNNGPLIFKQKRTGKNHKIFQIFKFRTMSQERAENGELLADKDRINFLGRILRRYSLDELPQIFNVLRGDLSLIGPRPLLPEYIDYYMGDENLRSTVKPGITGLAQIKGGNSLAWKDRFHWDIYYVKKRSFILDLTILFDTLKYLSKGNKILFSTSLLHLRKK